MGRVSVNENEERLMQVVFENCTFSITHIEQRSTDDPDLSSSYGGYPRRALSLGRHL